MRRNNSVSPCKAYAVGLGVRKWQSELAVGRFRPAARQGSGQAAMGRNVFLPSLNFEL
jgi:hypothetical protein